MDSATIFPTPGSSLRLWKVASRLLCGLLCSLALFQGRPIGFHNYDRFYVLPDEGALRQSVGRGW